MLTLSLRAVLLTLCFFSHGLGPVGFTIVTAESMQPTLATGDLLMTERRRFHAEELARGDLVHHPMAHRPDGPLYVKRIVALAGDVVEVRSGALLVNGRASELVDVPEGTQAVGPFAVPPATIFVMGDNVAKTSDSRHFGPVPVSLVQARIVCILWSPSRRESLRLFR